MAGPLGSVGGGGDDTASVVLTNPLAGGEGAAASGVICMLGQRLPAGKEWALVNAVLTVDHTRAIREAIGGGAERVMLQNCELSVEVASRLGGALCYPHPSRCLKQMDLSGTRLDVPGFRGIMQALKIGAHVARLSIDGCRVDDREGQVAMYLTDAPDLKHLLAGGNTLGHTETITPLIRALRSNTGLRTLDLSNAGLGPAASEVLTSVCQHPTLISLGFAGNAMPTSAAAGDVLFGCRPLRTLNVARNTLSDGEFITRLPLATSLRELNIASADLSAANAVVFRRALQQCEALHALDVSGNAFGDAGMAVWLHPDVLHAVRFLHLGNVGMTLASSTLICDFIEASQTLLSLRLDDNACVDPIEMSDIFQRHRELPLKGLSLARTKIPEEGLRLIMGTLSEYHRLQALVLDGLRMYSATLVAIIDSLVQPRSTVNLVQFSVDDNPIADLDDVHAACEALLLRNPRLPQISTRGTLIPKTPCIPRARYPAAGDLEVLRFTSEPTSVPIEDQHYSPSSMFHGVAAVDEP